MRSIWIILPLFLCGCQWIGDTADSLGEHLPVLGERCEHWQCITENGQRESDANKAAHPQTPAVLEDQSPQQPQQKPASDAPPAQ